MSTRDRPVRLGVDVLAAHPDRYPCRAVGLLTNDAARSGTEPSVHSRTALQRAGIPLRRLFSPEHGLQARAADGAAVPDDLDSSTRLPIVSLYGSKLAPTPDDLAGLDAVFIDLPDVGARFYTYAWTMTHLLDACEHLGVPVVVLDRPNPTGGLLVDAEGPMLETSCRSFLGRDATPVRHCLTIGELARRWKNEHLPNLELQVVECAGWRRDMHWPDTGLRFVPMSPAMPSYESAATYPGICLFESTNVGVGRYGDRPFRQLHAPWLDAPRLADAIPANHACEGIVARAVDSNTVDIDVPDPRAFRPVQAGVALLSLVAGQHRRHFTWSDYPTAANPSGAGHLERLLGRAGCRAMIEAGTPIDEAFFDASDWRGRVQPILLYE